MTSEDPLFLVDQCLVFGLGILFLALHLVSLYREPKIPAKTRASTAGRLAHFIRRCGLVVLALILARYVDPAGNHHMLPLLARNLLLANSAALVFAMIVIGVTAYLHIQYTAEMEELPTVIKLVAGAVCFLTLAVFNGVPVLNYWYDRRWFSGVTYCWVSLSAFAIGLSIAVAMYNLSFAVSQALYVLDPARHGAVNDKIRQMRIIMLVAVVLGMCIIMPIELVEGLDYLEDESSHAYKPNPNKFDFQSDSMPTWFELIALSFGVWKCWVPSKPKLPLLPAGSSPIIGRRAGSPVLRGTAGPSGSRPVGRGHSRAGSSAATVASSLPKNIAAAGSRNSPRGAGTNARGVPAGRGKQQQAQQQQQAIAHTHSGTRGGYLPVPSGEPAAGAGGQQHQQFYAGGGAAPVAIASSLPAPDNDYLGGEAAVGSLESAGSPMGPGSYLPPQQHQDLMYAAPPPQMAAMHAPPMVLPPKQQPRNQGQVQGVGAGLPGPVVYGSGGGGGGGHGEPRAVPSRRISEPSARVLSQSPRSGGFISPSASGMFNPPPAAAAGSGYGIPADLGYQRLPADNS